MKKKHIWMATIASFLLLSSMVAMKIVDHKPISDKQFLFDAGFKNIPGFKNWEKDADRKYWKEKGFNYITYAEADTLMKMNNFIIADADKYVGDIPDSTQSRIHKNYELLSDDLLNYVIVDTKGFLEQRSYTFSGNEVGWWMRNKESATDISCNFVSKKIHDRITDKAIAISGIPNTDDWVMRRDYSNSKIQVIGDPKYFAPGTTSDSAKLNPIRVVVKDPIAVIKQRKGFVVLAVWQ